MNARTSTLNLKEKVRKHIYSDSEGEMHWNTDVYHAPEFTYGNIHLLPKTSHLWILLERRETVRSISGVGVRALRGPFPSTRDLIMGY